MEKNKGLTGIVDVSGIFHYVRQQKASGHFIVELFIYLIHFIFEISPPKPNTKPLLTLCTLLHLNT